MDWNAKSLRSALLLILSGIVLSGCRQGESFERAAVVGTVELDGKPLSNGTVRFVPVDGTQGQKTSVPVLEGVFSAASQYGPAVGKHRIEIESTDYAGLALDDEEALQELAQNRTHRIGVVRVPQWYNQSSILKDEVHSGENVFKFELSSRRQR